MNKDKLSFVSGFMPALSLAILLGFQYAAQNGYLTVDPAMYALTEVAAFLLPFAVIMFLMKGSEGPQYRFKMFRMRCFSFVILASVALSFLAFLLNWIAAEIFTSGYAVQSSVISGGYPLWAVMLISIFLPALCEELFFRGALLPAQEGGGFYAAMIVSAISFALVHGDSSNILGPLACGLAYCYMTYITGSVWAAVIAHFINNSMTFGIGYLLKRYSAVGLWQYFIIIVLVAFFIFLYFSMGRLEKLVEKGKVPKITRVGFSKAVSTVFFAPGIWALLLLFIAKIFILK